MRSWLSLAALAVVVAALGLWAFYEPAPDSRNPAHALSSADAAAIARIRIERPGASGEAVSLEKAGADWRMTQPLTARADTFQVERILSVLGARSTARYSASDAGRYGLDKPLAVVTLNDEAFTFGAINKTTTEQYVAKGNDVYLVPLAIGASLPRNADALLARKLFAPDEAPKRFDIPGFTVALEEGTWAVAPAMPEVGPDQRNAWVDAWRQATAISVARSAASTSTEAINVQLKDDRTIALQILQREPELVLRRIDEGVAYHFTGAVGARMLAPPGAAPPERAK